MIRKQTIPGRAPGVSKWTEAESINQNTMHSIAQRPSEEDNMMLNMASSGLIQEVSQELESLNES